MSLRFSKMHGLGNDFMVVDAITQDVALDPEQIRRWADRQFGIGFDQMLVVEPPGNPDVSFRYRIFNADGSEVSQCGNGARCFAQFVRRQGLSSERLIRVETASGELTLEVLDDGQVTVNMGVPELDPARVPMLNASGSLSTPVPLADGRTIDVTPVSMGNPHAVTFHDRLTDELVLGVGPKLESHPWFPEHANVGFLQINSPDYGNLRVYERGAGETLACGSGACAALVAARQHGLMNDAVRLRLRGGELQLFWAGPGEPVLMTGPATHVFDGILDEEDESYG